MVHPHPITKVCTGNKTASEISNNTIKQQRSRATNMRYFCIRDQKTLKHFLIAWKAGQENIADYFTNNNNANHHKRVCTIYIHTDKTQW